MKKLNQPAVGIDLGTTFSVIAHVDEEGKPATIVNQEGDLLTPSVVLFEESGVTVGKEAQKAAPMEPHGFADAAKRDMGQKQYHRPIHGRAIPPEVIQSLILKKLKHDAEEQIGPFDKAVITVPAYFNEPRRKATQDAGRLAGLEVLDIINEPTAAAIAYGCGRMREKGESERVLVYDLGGGTFDVTLMEISTTAFNTIVTDGDVRLGGRDWDSRLADMVAERFVEKHRGIDPREDTAGRQRLMREAEEVKRALSVRQKATFTFEHAGDSIRLAVTRDEFEQLTANLLQRTLFTVRSVMKEGCVRWDQISRLVCVGGATRMPAVRRELESISGKKMERPVLPDEAVAHGAALRAGMLLNPDANAEIKNVNSHSLGVLSKDRRTGLYKNSIIIPKNTRLPVTKSKRFRTVHKNQRIINVRIIEGGDSRGRNSTVIGNCVIRDLPRELRAGAAVDVSFTYAENGRLVVRARVPDLNIEAVTTIERESGLSEQKIDTLRSKLWGKVTALLEESEAE